MKDSEFIRGKVPMTKEEIRTIILSKLELQPTDNMVDVGAGTGSIAIEAATLLTAGSVLAIEHNREGIDLIKQNCTKHHINNLKVVEASAPVGMEELSTINKYFIGGSGGNLEQILELIKKNAPDESIVVVSAIVIETMYKAFTYMKENGFDDVELIQIAINKVKTLGSSDMLMATNPIFIITGRTLKIKE